MYDICCIGHITLDKVVTPTLEKYMPGGTSFYFSNAIADMGTRYLLVTALAEKEMIFADELRARGIGVKGYLSEHTVHFENIYSENQDQRRQRVLQTADAFFPRQFDDVDAAMFHLGPLLAGDIPGELIKRLAAKGKISLDVQGFLREVRVHDVYAIDWKEKKEMLPFIHTLKANETEMEKLTGHADIHAGASQLAAWGVKEVVITLGSRGSIILSENIFYDIPAFTPATVTDATGCGDTYMAGYLSQRIKGRGVQEAGEFAAAMATLKIGSSGPFTGGEYDVLQLLESHPEKIFRATAG